MTHMTRRRGIALLAGGAAAGALLVGLGAAGAIAASHVLSPSDESKAVIDDAASQLGVKPTELSNALKRKQRGDGELFVKGPFPIPPTSRGDGGATQEYLWISVAACDDTVCQGTLSNTPQYASNLAAGKTTRNGGSDS